MAALSTRVSLRRAPVPKTLEIEGPGYIAFSEKFSSDSPDPIGVWNPSEFALFAVIEGFVGISYTISWWKAELPVDFKFIIAPDGSNLTTKTPIPEWNGKTKVEITNVGDYFNPSKSWEVIGCTLTWSNGVDVITVSRAKPIQISKETSTYGHYITRLITSIESLEKQENSLINNQPPVSTTLAQEMSSARVSVKEALSDLRGHLQNNSWYAANTRQKVKDCDNKLLLYTNAVSKAQSYLSNSAWTTAISKVTNYTSQPTSYKKGDFWTLEKDYIVEGKVWKEGSRVSATTDSDSFNWAHWKNPNFITLDDIAVGGVNLLRGGKEVIVQRKYKVLILPTPISKGTEITISIGKIVSNFDGRFRLLLQRSGSSHTVLFFDKQDTPQSQTIIAKDRIEKAYLYSSNDYQDSTDYTTVWHEVKIEVGNIATAWSPAPEDVEESTSLSILSSSIITKNTAKASALIDAITKKRKEIEARYLKISSICPDALKAQLLNTFTSYKGAEETLRNACNDFIQGTDQSDAKYTQVIGEATTGGKPHNLYTDALDTYTRVEAEADRGKDGKEVRPNLLEGTNFGKPMVFSMIADPSFAIYSEDMYPCVEVGYGWGFRSKNMTLQPGTYTISCLVKSALDTPSQPRISSTDIFGIKYFDLIDNTKWVPLKHSFTLTETKTGIFYFLAENAQGRVKFAQIKLEAGDGSTAYVVHPNDLIPPIKWVGTSLKINDGAPVQLKGEKGDTGEFSPEQSAMLSAHEVSINQHGGQISQLQGSVSTHGNQINQQGNTISLHGQTIDEHTQSITELTQNFGMEVPSILISNTQQYIQVLEEIEQQAMAKSGKVCSTIRLTSSNMPIILPCPEKFVDRQITIARLAEPLNYCALFHDCIYIHTTKNTSSVGVLAGGSMPFNNFVYYSQAPSYAGCRGYRINQNITGLNKFRALTEIDCNQSLSLTFLAVNYSGVHRWLLMDVSAFDAHISPNEAGTIWGAVRQVRGQEPWTIKHNGQIVPASKHSASTFTVTELMGWIEYNGSGRTTTMDFPASLSEGFMCYVQNNARQPLTVSGCSPVGTLRDVPARSLCLCRKGTRNNMLIFQLSTI